MPLINTNTQDNQVANIANQFGQPINLRSTAAAQDVSALSVLGSLAKGYVQGFTTFEVGEPASNPAEAVAHSIGSLAGFIGFVPGAGTLGGLLTKGLAKSARLAFRGEKSLSLLAGVERAGLYLPSVPMGAANVIFKGAEKLGAKNAINVAEKYLLSRGIGQEAINIGGHSAKQAFHLGTAMAVSSWQGGADAIMSSFTYGTVFGAGSAILGQALPTAGRDVTAGRLSQLLQDVKDPRGIARITSSAIFAAIPSYLSDAPFELQVYEFLLGGYFGAIEMPISERRALDFLRLAPQKIYGDVELSRPAQEMMLANFRRTGSKIAERYNALKRRDPEAAAIVARQIQLKGLKMSVDAENGVSIAGMKAAEGLHMALKRKEGAIPEEQLRAMLGDDMFKSATQLAKERSGLEPDPNDPDWNLTLHKAFMDVMEQSAESIEDYAKTRQYKIKEQREELKFIEQFKTAPETRELVMLEEELRSDKDYPRSLIPTTKKIARQVYESVKQTKKNAVAEDYLKAQIQVKDVFKKYIADKANPKAFGELVKDIESTLKIKIVEGHGLWKDVRKSWNWSTRLEPMLQKSLHRKGGELSVQVQNELDINGHNVTKFVETPYLWERLGKEVFNIKSSRAVFADKDKFTDEVSFRHEDVKPFDDPKFNLTELTLTLHKEGETILFASKDSGILVGMPYDKNAKDPEVVKDYLDVLKAEIPGFEQDVAQLRQDFIDEAKALKTNKFTDDEIESTFWQSFVNNIIAREKLERVPIVKILQNPDNFLFSKKSPVAEWTKRTSLLNNGFLRVDPEFMKTVEGAENGLSLLIINDLNANGMDMVKDAKDITMWYREDNKIIEKKTNAHVDGPLLLRNDVFDRLALQGGLEINTGAQKGTFLHAEPERGLMIGKLAYHRAGNAISADMLTKNLHGIINTTAAKQIGLRKKYDAQWADGKLDIYEEGTQNLATAVESYTIPHDAFTYTEGGEHLDRALRPQKIASQFMSGIDSKRFPETSKWLNELSEQNFLGNERAERLYNKFTEGDTTVDPNKIDVEELSVQTLVDIFTSGKNDVLWKKVYDTYIAKNEDFEDGDTPWDSNEEYLLKQMTQQRAAADRILDVAEVSPAILATPMVQKYVQTVFKSALSKRIIRPKLEGSSASILSPYRWDLIEKMKAVGGLQEGQMLLGNAYKDFTRFPWMGKTPAENKVRLEDALLAYEDLKSRKNLNKAESQRLKQIKEDLTFLVERIPTDSPSGIRPIELAGFSDIDGSGVVLHPEDMINLGGADLDIDKAYLYNGMPSAVKKEFDATKYEWYDFYGPLSSKKISEELYRSNPSAYAKVLKDSKPSDSPFIKPGDAQWKKNKMSVFSPLHLGRAGRIAYEGNKSLGPAISAAKKMTGLAEAKLSELEINDVQKFRDLKRQFVNFGADAANGTELIGIEESIHKLAAALFKARVKKDGEVETDAELFARVKKNKVFKQLSKLETFNRGTDRSGVEYNLGDYVALAQDAAKQLSSPKLQFNSAYYKNLLKLGELNILKVKENPFLDARAPENFNEIARQLKQSKDFVRLVGRDYNGLLFYNNFRNSKTGAYNKATNSFERMLIANEITAQSGLDAANAINILYQAPKNKLGGLDVDLKVTDDLLAKADAIKRKFNTSLITKKQAKRMGSEINTSQLKLEADREIENITNIIPKPYKKLFHSYILSSLSYQKSNLETFVADYKAKAIAKVDGDIASIDKAITDRKLREGKTDKLELRKKQKLEEREIIGKSVEAEAKSLWWETNQNSWVYELNSIDPQVIKDQLDVYNDLIQKVNTSIPDDFLVGLDRYLDSDSLTRDIEQPSIERVNFRFLNYFQNYKRELETTQRAIDPKIELQLNQARDTIAEFYTRYPELIKDIEPMFAGESQLQKSLLGFEGGNTLRLATPTQLIEFSNVLRAKLDNAGKNFELKKYHYFYRPETIGEIMRTYEDAQLVSEEIPIRAGLNVTGFGEVKKMTSTMQKVNSIWNWGERAFEGGFRATEYKYKTNSLVIGLNTLNKKHDDLGKRVWNIATRFREKGIAKIKGQKEDYTKLYKKYWEEVRPEYEKLINGTEKYLLPSISNKPLSGRELFEQVVEFQNTALKDVLHNKMVNKPLEQAFFAKVTDENGNVDTEKAFELLSKELSANQFIFRGVNFVNKLMHYEILNKIKLNGDTFFKYLYRKSKGAEIEGNTMEDLFQDPDFNAFWGDLQKGITPDSLTRSDAELIDIYLKKYNDYIEKQADFSLVIEEIPDAGIRSRLLTQLRNSKFNESGWMDYKDFQVADWFHKYYYPHNTFLEKATKKYLLDRVKSMVEGTFADGGTENQIALLKHQIESQLGNSDEKAHSAIRHLEDLLDSDGLGTKNIENFSQQLASTMERDRRDPLPGWTTDMDVLIKYENQIDRFYYSYLASSISRHQIKALKKKQGLGDFTDSWARFLSIYNRDQLGHASKFPDAWLNDPNLKLKGNPYYALTDDYWERKAKKIGYKFFNGKRLYKDTKELGLEDKFTPELRQKIVDDPRTKELLETIYANSVDKRFSWLSQVEGKFELMTLLSHPKTLVNNFFSGDLNTISQTGVRHWANTRNINYLTQEVFPGTKSKTDIDAIVEKNGGVEAMFFSEFGLNRIFNGGVYKRVATKVMESLKKDGYSEKTIKDIVREEGLGEAFLNTAGYFMRTSEISLRRRSWLAHYEQAREALSVNGMHLEPEHPWLVQWANKGVGATQFLYNNANRPAFVRTSLGKMFGRFQLWAWNSLYFRKEVLKMGYSVGYRPGTAEYSRMRRLLTADMFVMALGAALPYSMFDSTVAPPLGYVLDLSAWMFGDQEERDKAFFGVLPYPANIVGLVAPPISRYPFAFVSTLINGNLDAAGRALMTSIPFGRLGTSFYRSIDSPIMTIDNFTGLPFVKTGAFFKKQFKNKVPYNINPLLTDLSTTE